MPSVSDAGRRLRRRHATGPTWLGRRRFNPSKSEHISRRWRRVALAAASPQAAAEPWAPARRLEIQCALTAPAALSRPAADRRRPIALQWKH